MGPRRVGHRYHRQDVSHALRVTVDRSKLSSQVLPAPWPVRCASAVAASSPPAPTACSTARNSSNAARAAETARC